MRRWERGQVLPYVAVFLALVVVPLAVLAVDVVRALYVRTHLQTATDAACEAAAQAIDAAAFRSGTDRIDLGLGAGYAQREFAATVAEKGIVGYGPALTAIWLQSPTIVACRATASVHLLIPASPVALNVSAVSVSEMRVRRR
ncbi:MAG: pilus assembly protein TadG-related protein [Thermanaerothrix sp.]|uniref:pilus assembly protein TadG-related protein n=1 Tax=Thermanaerothrix sp. TaxID=2972675 RepID=UPI003C7A0C6F